MAIYMKFGVIDGPVTTDGFQKWIELNSVNMGIHRTTTTNRRQAQEASSRNRRSTSPSSSTRRRQRASSNRLPATLGTPCRYQVDDDDQG
jgi:type VI protein secretion system component Hcp